MIKLPNFKKSFEYENNFYLSCDSSRIGKVLAHYELFKIANYLPGSIVECGVFKGASLSRFSMMRELFGNSSSKKLLDLMHLENSQIRNFIVIKNIEKILLNHLVKKEFQKYR